VAHGADLSALGLSGLPLARMQGGLTGPEYDHAAPADMDAAAVLMSGTILRYAHLEEAAEEAQAVAAGVGA
jgi:hypothetical protein